MRLTEILTAERVTTQLTAFTVRARSARAIDLVAPPFARFRAAIASPSSYADTQALGTAMRAAGVELFRYPSARDATGGGGINVGVLAPTAFGAAKPRGLETWHCTASRDRVEVVKRDYFETAVHLFPREQFLVNGVLPAPAV